MTEAARRIAGFLGAAVVTTSTLTASINTSSATAAPCPDVEVVFARGTNEPPGVGAVGQAFVDSLSSQAGGRSVGVYAVNYPATDAFSSSSAAGASDTSGHVQSMAANCPNTRMMLGGYSQGALLMDLATEQMSPNVANNVAAVAVFGNPSPNGSLSRALARGRPIAGIGPLYTSKTVDMCVPGDPICTNGVSMGPHVQYVQSGMTNQAATFAVGRL